MIKNKLTYITLLAMLSFCSCKKDPDPYVSYSDEWSYDGGDAQVDEDEEVEIEFDIESNLNVDGSVEITSGINIENDLNLNDDGLVVIDPSDNDDTIRISGNINANDSLVILGGCILLEGDFNINASGVVNIGDDAKVNVAHDLNNSGQLYGNRNLTVEGVTNLNGDHVTEEIPLFSN